MQLAICPSPAVSSQAKEQLFASLCHEIRNPLNAVVGISRILANSQFSVEKQDECVHMLEQSANMLEELLNDVLDYSKIDAGMMELEAVPFNLEQLVQDAVQMVKSRAQEKGLLIHTHCPELPALRGDPLRLKQIMLNLLSNAVKFTDKGFISVYIQATPNLHGEYALRLTVTDTGIGIHAAKLATLFDEYRQGSASTARHHGGSGLGLAICKRLLTLMGGTISAASLPDAGSQFTVLLDLPKN